MEKTFDTGLGDNIMSTYSKEQDNLNEKEILDQLSYIICLNEISKYKVLSANKETIKMVKEKADDIDMENVIFIESPTEYGIMYAINDGMLKYTILLERGLIEKNIEVESKMFSYDRSDSKSKFEVYDMRGEIR